MLRRKMKGAGDSDGASGSEGPTVGQAAGEDLAEDAMAVAV